MANMWWLWLKHRWRCVSAVGIVLLATVFAVFLFRGSTGLSLTFLGNVDAPRAEASSTREAVTLPRSTDPKTTAEKASGREIASILDDPKLSNSGPQTVAVAQRGWTTADIEQHQDDVLRAVNCVREQRGELPLTLDPALSQTAEQAWLSLVQDPSWSLMDLPGHYALRSIAVLDNAAPAAPARLARGQPARVSHEGCGVGGFDPSAISAPQKSERIGIAVFPPQASWDASSVVVLVQ